MDAKKIVSACLQGDRRAQGQLYGAFAPYSLAVIRRFGVNASREKDLLQEIFIEVFAKLGRFDEKKGTFKTWLRQLTVFRIVDFQRKGEHLKFLSLDAPEFHEPAAEVSFEQLSPNYLRRRIAELPSGYRTVFNLFAIEGLSHQRIADLLGVNPATSRSQYHRARQLLQVSCRAYAQKKICCHE